MSVFSGHMRIKGIMRNWAVFTCGGPLNRIDLGWYFSVPVFSVSFLQLSAPVSPAFVSCRELAAMPYKRCRSAGPWRNSRGDGEPPISLSIRKMLRLAVQWGREITASCKKAIARLPRASSYFETDLLWMPRRWKTYATWRNQCGRKSSQVNARIGNGSQIDSHVSASFSLDPTCDTLCFVAATKYLIEAYPRLPRQWERTKNEMRGDWERRPSFSPQCQPYFIARCPHAFHICVHFFSFFAHCNYPRLLENHINSVKQFA